MKRHTQTDTEHGNCWQTALACILDVEPERLPPQVYWEQQERPFNGWGTYTNILNGYLGKHHGLMYAEVYDYQFGALKVKAPGYHLLIGPTIRTEKHRAEGRPHIHHCIVARYGKPLWDVHPSRAGLTAVERWGVLAPLPKRIRQDRLERSREDADYRRVFIDCVCPECYGK